MLIAGLAAVAAPMAEASCPNAAERMDRYFDDRRGITTYRALSGLGDPQVPDHFYEQVIFHGSDEDRKLLDRMFPVDPSSQYSWDRSGECRPDYALKLLRGRIANLGEQHPYVAHWLMTQRAVFSACRGRGAQAVRALPPPLPTSDRRVAALQRHDRAYQAASLLFYARNPAAREAFRAIAGSASPHAPIARYMLLAVEAEREGAEPARLVREAEAVLANRKLASIHPLVQGLIGSLGWNRGHPEVRRAQVRIVLDVLKTPTGKVLADPIARERYARAAADIPKLHDRFPDPAWWLTGAIPTEASASRAMAAAAVEDRMAAWLLMPSASGEVGAWAARRKDAGDEGWRRLNHYLGEAPDQLEWRVLEAAYARSHDPAQWTEFDHLLAGVRGCPDDRAMAALPLLFHHRVRSALMYPPEEERKSAFEAALSRMEAWPWRDSGHFRTTASKALAYLIASGRLGEARTLRDRLLADSPSWEDDVPLLLLAENEDRLVGQLRKEAAYGRPALLNLLSVPALKRLAARQELPREQRALYARVAWTRLYALGRRIEPAFDRLMRELNPEITGGWISGADRGGKGGNRRLLLDVLRSPGLNILITDHQRQAEAHRDEDPGLTKIDVYEHSDNNWWCVWQPDRHSRAADQQFFQHFFEGGLADDLSVAGAKHQLAPLLRESWLWRARNPSEEQALAVTDCAPKLLSERAIAWAERPGLFGRRDEQVEALALAVRATRYGCQRQGGHRAYSKAAFQLLHRRFPGSEAAKRTKYWFDCAHFSGGCPSQRPR